MNTVYTTTPTYTHYGAANVNSLGYEVANPIVSMGRWEFILYLVIAFLVGYFIHYIFSSRRDYVRAPRGHRYYSNSEPVYPARY